MNCNGCENLIEGECRVFVTPILNADGDCRARGWVWLNGWEQQAHDDHRVVIDPSKLTALREAAGLSAYRLAVLASLNKKDVRLIEMGRRAYTTGKVAERLAEALGVGMEELTG